MTITSTYASFVLDTGPLWMGSQTERHNAVARLNYDTEGFLTRGKSADRVVGGGQYFAFQLLLSLTPRAQNMGILTSTTPAITETGVNASAYWRILGTHIAWDDRVRALNAGGSVGTEGGFQTFKRMAQMDMQEMWTDYQNKVDDNLWAPAVFAEMEGATGTQPYSLPAILNEFTDGLVPSTAGGTASWTAMYGVPSSTSGFSNFAPQRFGYSNVNVSAPLNLISRFDLAFFKLAFKAPPTNQQYFDDTSGLLPAQMFIACSPEGAAKLKAHCRDAQSDWSNKHDGYGGRETYAGVPVVPVGKLTSAAIFPTGASGAYSTELVTTNSNAGPRYHLINANDIDVVKHNEYDMKVTGTQDQYGNPSRKAIFYETMHNMIARKRRTSGIIYPTANIP